MPALRGKDRGSMRALPLLLLLLPVIGLIWVPFYDRQAPALFGFPFFYWYQFLWVPVTSLLIWLAWRLERRS